MARRAAHDVRRLRRRDRSAVDAARGVPLWRSGLHTSITNGPMTYELDGVQHVVVGAGDSLYAFALRGR